MTRSTLQAGFKRSSKTSVSQCDPGCVQTRLCVAFPFYWLHHASDLIKVFFGREGGVYFEFKVCRLSMD